jgi:hypothetical protein
VGEHGQDRPEMPGGPTAQLVLIESGEFLAGLNDSSIPAGSGDPGRIRCTTQVCTTMRGQMVWSSVAR